MTILQLIKHLNSYKVQPTPQENLQGRDSDRKKTAAVSDRDDQQYGRSVRSRHDLAIDLSANRKWKDVYIPRATPAAFSSSVQEPRTVRRTIAAIDPPDVQRVQERLARQHLLGVGPGSGATQYIQCADHDRFTGDPD